ncbi:hypothetical protein MBLNU13_g06899t1 [Cladosporium sp. NU13]
MFQFKCDLLTLFDGEPDNTYWAIGGTAVDTAAMRLTTRKTFNGYMPRPTVGDDAVAHFDRKAHGLTNYGESLAKELKELIRARGIELPIDCVRKEALIAELEKEDNEVKLTKFLKLPAELRNNVYGKYFENLGDLPLLPQQPPLLLASRQLRKEAMSKYYSHSTFTLGFLTNLRTPDIMFPSPGRSQWHLRTTNHKDTDALLKRISDQDFANTRHLKIQVWKRELDIGETIVSFATWTVDLGGSGKVAITHEHQDYTSYVWAPMFRTVGEMLEPALKVIWECPETQKISKADVYSLKGVIHHAML